MYKIFKTFWKSLNSKFKLYFIISIVFSLISSIAEMMTIGSFLPLIGFVIAPEVTDNLILSYIIDLNSNYPLGFENNLSYLSMIFLLFVIIKHVNKNINSLVEC